MLVENGQGLMLDRRRFLTLTAGNVSATALLGLGGMQSAFAAVESVRWVSPRGTIEVLDDYPYWVAKKYGYFGDIQTTLEPGPSDATATVKLVDQKQSDMGYPSPGVFSLGLEQGIPLVSVFHMGGSDVFDIAFRKGEKAKSVKDLEGKTILLGSAGCGAATEHRQASQDPALRVVQQIPAPVHDGAQGLVAWQRGPAARGEQAEPVVEPARHLGRGQ